MSNKGGGNKMKKWKTAFLVSLVLTVIFMILCGVLNADSTRGIWQVMKVLCYIAIAVDIISIVGCIAISIKNKEKMPVWLIVVIAIIIAMCIILLIGSISQNNFDKKSDQAVNKIDTYTDLLTK